MRIKIHNWWKTFNSMDLFVFTLFRFQYDWNFGYNVRRKLEIEILNFEIVFYFGGEKYGNM